jgi:hypothetical protein
MVENVRSKAVQIKKNWANSKNENYSQTHLAGMDASHSQHTMSHSASDMSNAVFSISKYDQVNAATDL